MVLTYTGCVFDTSTQKAGVVQGLVEGNLGDYLASSYDVEKLLPHILVRVTGCLNWTQASSTGDGGQELDRTDHSQDQGQ